MSSKNKYKNEIMNANELYFNSTIKILKNQKKKTVWYGFLLGM
jgi:hypothetical protein